MGGCQCTMNAESKQPSIAILMAVYNPRMDWFRQQLQSLNRQTYPNLRLYVRDDCSPKVSHEEIRAAVAECITAFPYTVIRNEQNVGSNMTFQLLTQDAQGDMFAYCDQDDIWLPEKLEIMARDMQETGALLVCCDVAIIDGNGTQTASSIVEVRKHCIMKSGDDLAPGLLFRNYVFGCASLVDGKAAKAAVPFCPHYYHDHYLTLWCAEHGSIHAEPKALIQYRQHGGNQTGVMLGVTDKQSYTQVRIQIIIDRLTWLDQHFDCCPETKQAIHDGLCWANARLDNWTKHRSTGTMWRYRHLGFPITFFEVFAARMPNWMLMAVMKLLRSNII